MRILFIFILSILILPGCASDVPRKKCDNPDALQNQEIAKQYYANNLNKRDFIKSETGLKYKILKIGNGGIRPGKANEIIAHYEIHRLDGTKIDSSYDRGKPAIFKLDEVFTGWRMTLEEMVKGEKRVVYLPPEYAFGCKGQLPRIGSNETLIFTTELVDIK